jgi:hypothetical protein
MTKKIKQYSLMLLFLTVFSGRLFGQENARVVAIFNLGIIEYAYLFDESNQLYLKSTAFQSGSITEGQDVELIPFTTNSNPKIEKQLKINGQNVAIYAELLLNDNFSLPASALFGMPWVERDILFFSSKEHLAEFIDILSDFSDSRFEEFYFLMSCFERQFPNYKSFNRMLHENYNYFYGEIDDITRDEINSVDYFRDDIFKTITNEFGEIGIGDSVHVMKKIDNNCYTFIFDKMKENEYELLRSFSAVDFEENLVSLKSKNKTFKEGFEIPSFTKSYYMTYSGNIPIAYFGGFNAEKVNCSSEKVKINYILERTYGSDDLSFLDQNQFSGLATIDWGDGTTSTQVINAPSLNLIPETPISPATYSGFSTFTISHTYQTINQTYNIVVNLVINSESVTNPSIFTLSDDVDFTQPTIPCTDNSYNSGELFDELSSTLRMVSEGFINNWYAWHSIGAKTSFEEKKSNGWKKEKADLEVEIYGTFRQNDCTVAESKHDDKTKENKKEISVSVQKWWRKWSVANGDCYSTHKVTKNGNFVTRTIVFNPC